MDPAPGSSGGLAQTQSSLAAAGVTLALQDFIDAALINIEGRGNSVLKFSTPMTQPNLHCVIEGKHVRWRG